MHTCGDNCEEQSTSAELNPSLMETKQHGQLLNTRSIKKHRQKERNERQHVRAGME